MKKKGQLQYLIEAEGVDGTNSIKSNGGKGGDSRITLSPYDGMMDHEK